MNSWETGRGDQGTDLEADDDQVQQHENFITFVKHNSFKRVSDITMEDFDDDDLELGIEPNSSSTDTDKTSCSCACACDTLHSTPSSDTCHSTPSSDTLYDIPFQKRIIILIPDEKFLDDGDAELDEHEHQVALLTLH